MQNEQEAQTCTIQVDGLALEQPVRELEHGPHVRGDTPEPQRERVDEVVYVAEQAEELRPQREPHDRNDDPPHPHEDPRVRVDRIHDSGNRPQDAYYCPRSP